ncbi:MAG: lysophospholipid acyltransferase family protein [Desulfobulbaceae bacterium]|jgi:lysophospholipid acyltransferase (LPLAT)-like uncharacterized protein|nr:lysophospholipid acyltransferase family protein [Desulfobulbaceae bacterium]
MKDHGFLYETSIRIGPPLLSCLMRMWFSTCELVDHQHQHLTDALVEGQPVIVPFWHYSMLLTLWRVREYSAAAMVSSSRDGEYTARLLKRFGFFPVRGSRHRKGVAALITLIKHMRDSRQNCGIVADGSQGPPLVVQPGCLLLAARTGAPIIPLVCSARRYGAARSWDRTVFPKPFSRIDAFWGQPMRVPADADSAALERYRLLLQEQMLELYRLAWQQQGKEEH